jgi:hypothetical protein
MGGHVLRERTSRGMCGLGCPSHTSERGGEGDCVREGGGGEGERERERAREVRLHYILGYSGRHESDFALQASSRHESSIDMYNNDVGQKSAINS